MSCVVRFYQATESYWFHLPLFVTIADGPPRDTKFGFNRAYVCVGQRKRYAIVSIAQVNATLALCTKNQPSESQYGHLIIRYAYTRDDCSFGLACWLFHLFCDHRSNERDRKNVNEKSLGKKLDFVDKIHKSKRNSTNFSTEIISKNSSSPLNTATSIKKSINRTVI